MIMNRKELVIITLIVNMALLGLLFVTAYRVEDPVEQIEHPAHAQPMQAAITPKEQKGSKTAIAEKAADSAFFIEEADNVLRDYAVSYGIAQKSRPVDDIADGLVAMAKKEPSVHLHQPAKVVEDTSDAAASNESYLVKKGDFLEKIAKAHGTTIEAIKTANKLSNDNLRVGQQLLIPQTKTAAVASNRAESTSSQEKLEDGLYRMKSGDNPWKIAKQFHIDVEELLKLNNLDEASARNLRPGNVLRVKERP